MKPSQRSELQQALLDFAAVIAADNPKLAKSVRGVATFPAPPWEMVEALRKLIDLEHGLTIDGQRVLFALQRYQTRKG